MSNLNNTNITTNNSTDTGVVYTGGTICSTTSDSIFSITHTSYSTTKEYVLDNYRFSMNRYLSYEEVSFIVNLTLNGTRYYDLSIENGIYLQHDLSEKIEPIIKMMRRKEKARSILDKK